MTADLLPIGLKATIINCSDMQMQEIGFIAGEIIKVRARAPFNGPKAVRVGLSTFALRDEELAAVEIEFDK